jgi:hypothetical protein
MRSSVSLRRAVAAAVVGIAAVTSPVAASPPTAETMILIQDADTFETLSWSASGTFTDECQPGGYGNPCWTVDRLVIGAPQTLLFGIVETTQTSALGSFRLDFHGGTTPVGSVAAPWRLYGGTGVYKNVRGTGVWTQAIISGPPEHKHLLVFTLSGSVH